MTNSNSELLQQFIPEARDLLEQAGRSLLELERAPDGAEAMNALFRAVHTLKGTSGLFEIAPLTRVVHAAEDLLGAVQAGEMALAAETADVLLSALDLIGVWIEGLALAGELPDAAEADSGTWVARLRANLLSPGRTGPQSASWSAASAIPGWVQVLGRDECEACASQSGDGSLFAVSYAPDPNCFFRGEDPLALMRQIEGLRLLRLTPVTRWPGLDEMDPFLCHGRLHGIAAAPLAELEHLFRYVRDQVEIAPLPAGWPARRDGGSPMPSLSAVDAEAVRIVLDSQLLLLTGGEPGMDMTGRIGAAARAVAGALRYAVRDDLVARLQQARAEAMAAKSPKALLAFIDALGQEGLVPGGLPGRRGRGAGPAPSDAPPAGLSESRTGMPATLRVEQGKIDALMNLIGELVVAKNALAYLARQAEDGSLGVRELARAIKDRQALVNRIAEDMQAAVMAVRMLPVEHVFQRFPRLVRDIARRLDKRVELVVQGGETEADKNVIEALSDPLIHLVRNSLDHGIEPPEDRRAAGKPEHGTIRLEAMQDNDHVVIRIVDDGRGIDPAKVRDKAIEKGLLDAERAAALSDEEAALLVFAPGFSTASAVSDLSGRGVGMDVVRSAVEKSGGQVALRSVKGAGTTVELMLPLSMAVTRIMTVAVGGRLFGVPMALVAETVRVRRAALHRLRDREAFVLRDIVVPVVRLARLLDLPDAMGDHDEQAILVVRMNGERLGIVVDAFREGMEVIVKPMEGVLGGLNGFAGTTLLGDGQVLLILDLRELVGQ
jgi:two-component system chemotaxis sensor kinase CheA